MQILTSPNSKAWCIIAAMSLLSMGCQKNTNDLAAGTKGISLYLTDDPSILFDNIFIDIQKVEIKAEDDNEAEHEHGRENEIKSEDDHGGNSGNWITLNSSPKIYDILKFRNGLDTLLSSGFFPSIKSLKKIRLTLGNNNKVVYNGITYSTTLKEKFIVINLEDAIVTFNASGNTNIWLDFDGSRSITLHGKDFEMDPSIKAFSKEKAGSIEGRILPVDAQAIITVTNGTDTATAKPGREGEFKIPGLKAGLYKLVAHATANNYVDATVSNIIVKTKEDSQAGTITLHK